MSAASKPSPLYEHRSAAADVSVSGLAKRYGDLHALRGISFEARSGEIFGLLGPNGAGKTTTLECLLGLRRPDAGRVWIGGIDALAEPAKVRRIVGAQLQSAALQDKITPTEALRLFGSFYPRAVEPNQALARFGLLDKAHASFDSLSSGQRQRLLLSLAFLHRPRLVVLDEPTAGLDPQSRRELHQIITGLRAEGCTILLSTHYLEEAQQLCDRIAILHQGSVVATGAPAELIAAARTPTRLLITTQRALGAEHLGPVEAVLSVQLQGATAVIGTSEVSRTIASLAKQLELLNNPLVDVQIQRPSLEDVFIEHTGEQWTSGGGPAAANAEIQG